MFTVLAGMAEYERELIRSRINDKLNVKRQRGEVIRRRPLRLERHRHRPALPKGRQNPHPRGQPAGTKLDPLDGPLPLRRLELSRHRLGTQPPRLHRQARRQMAVRQRRQMPNLQKRHHLARQPIQTATTSRLICLDDIPATAFRPGSALRKAILCQLEVQSSRLKTKAFMRLEKSGCRTQQKTTPNLGTVLQDDSASCRRVSKQRFRCNLRLQHRRGAYKSSTGLLLGGGSDEAGAANPGFRLNLADVPAGKFPLGCVARLVR